MNWSRLSINKPILQGFYKAYPGLPRASFLSLSQKILFTSLKKPLFKGFDELMSESGFFFYYDESDRFNMIVIEKLKRIKCMANWN